jgi:cytochrome c biogenesis protein CcmG/thiol:disulfide interchange protein DsbE
MFRKTWKFVVSQPRGKGISQGRNAGVLILCLAMVFVFLPASAAPRKASLINKPAPPFARASLRNEPVDLGALRGRVVLLNFWATWCAPCQAEMPRFVHWQEKYSGQGLSIVGVSMDDDPETVQSFLRRKKLNYPVVMGDEKLGLAYGGVLGLPVTYLIDRQGVIRARYQGGTDLDAMETAIRQLLNPR